MKKQEKIRKAIEEFEALQSREVHPDGEFDNAGRWYPSDTEKADCCKGLRSPSRAYPYSLMVHCRTLKHICTKYDLDYREVKKIMNAEKPKREIEKQIMYKRVALIGSKIQSIFSGETYIIGKTYTEKVKDNHQGGYYAYKTENEAFDAVFPDNSVHSGADVKRITVKVEMWGRHICYGNKYAFSYMKIIDVA